MQTTIHQKTELIFLIDPNLNLHRHFIQDPMASSSLVFLITTNTLDNETRLARLTTLFQEHPSLTDSLDKSPIGMAVESRCTLEIVRFLIDQGCPVDKRASKHTPLSLAVRFGRSDLVDLFLDKGASHAKKSGDFSTPPIVYSAQLQTDTNISILTSLLRYDPHQINWIDRNGVTALRSAAKYGNLEAVRVLLSRGADPTIADKNGMTPLKMCRSNDFFPSNYISDVLLTNIKNRRLIAKLLEEEERAYLVYKGKAIFHANFVAKYYYPRNIWSLNHLPEILKKRVCFRKNLPSVFFSTQGLCSVPGGKIVQSAEPHPIQEILYEVWLKSNSDIFRYLMNFLV